MPASTPDLPVLVAGGGIGGLAAALALVRQGFAVTVLEQAPELGEDWDTIFADVERVVMPGVSPFFISFEHHI